ncbi:hypothetical protein Tco_0859932 [Tanacetum coccineum]|uniref:Uncharacterized protein n=1 Tax=Tanacetum coccineum TaxID=301880 RepID=A0ABQ5BDH5_9ASTR
MENIKKKVNVPNADKKQLQDVQGRYATKHDVVDDVDLTKSIILLLSAKYLLHELGIISPRLNNLKGCFSADPYEVSFFLSVLPSDRYAVVPGENAQAGNDGNDASIPEKDVKRMRL